MKQIYYVIQALIHGRSSNIIKVVSLGLGLTMSILLFSRVVYEQSFDTCFKDHDKLYQLWNIWTVNGNLFLLVNILSVQLPEAYWMQCRKLWNRRQVRGYGRYHHLFTTEVSVLMILKLLLIHCFFRQWVLRS